MKATLLKAASLSLAFLFSSVFSSNTQLMNYNETPKEAIKMESSPNDFVSVNDGYFELNSSEFRFIGTNNYYLHYKDKIMVKDAIVSAANAGFNVIRTWGFFDGMGDDYNKNHAFMQPTAESYTAPVGMPSYYVNCWETLDYALDIARQNDVKLIIVFTNYWTDFGGVTQYVKWSDKANGIDTTSKKYSADLSKFYTDSLCKQYYKSYINYFLNRTNSVNGLSYKDDPTVMAYELMNEPRNPGKDPSILTSWASEMSDYVRSIDSNHLIALGDEGFYSGKESEAYDGQSKDSYNGSQGISYDDIIKLKNINFGTYHLYPEGWGATDVAQLWGEKWISDHINTSTAANKPCVCEEFGINAQNGQNRELIYSDWCQKIYDLNGAGGLFWMLAGKDTGTSAFEGYYPDYDGYRLLWKGETDSDPEVIALHDYATLFTYGKDFVDFEDKVFLMAPYRSKQNYSDFGPILVDSDTTPIYNVKVYIRSSKKVDHVSLYTSNKYAGKMELTNSGYYTLGVEMKYYVRSAVIGVYAVCHFADGTTLKSDIGKLERQLNYSMELDKTYEFSDSETDSPKLDYYGDCNVISFSEVKKSTFNGGSYAITCSSNPSTWWSELKIKVEDLGSILTNHHEVDYDVYYKKDLCIPYDGTISASAEATNTTYGFRNYAALDPNWTKLCLNQNNIKAKDCDVVTIDGVDYYKQTVKIPYSASTSQTLLVLGVVFNYMGYEGDLYIDNLKFFNKIDQGTMYDGVEERPIVEDPDATNDDNTKKNSNNLPLILSLSIGIPVASIGIGTLIYFLLKSKKKKAQ